MSSIDVCFGQQWSRTCFYNIYDQRQNFGRPKNFHHACFVFIIYIYIYLRITYIIRIMTYTVNNKSVSCGILVFLVFKFRPLTLKLNYSPLPLLKISIQWMLFILLIQYQLVRAHSVHCNKITIVLQSCANIIQLTRWTHVPIPRIMCHPKIQWGNGAQNIVET